MMNEEFFASFADKAKSMMDPLSKLNGLMWTNMEKVAEFQMDAMKSYAEMASKQIKEAAQIRDLESLKSFGVSQMEYASTLSKKILEDLKTLGEMGAEIKDEAEKAMKEAKGEKDAEVVQD